MNQSQEKSLRVKSNHHNDNSYVYGDSPTHNKNIENMENLNSPSINFNLISQQS